MLIIDTMYRYQLFEHIEAHCQVRIYQHNERYVVIASELPDNKNIAITNSWPELMYGLIQQYGLNMAHTVWIEHYPQADYAQHGDRGDTFDQVTLEDGTPHWRRMTAQEIAQLTA